MTSSSNARAFQPTRALLCVGVATLFWLLNALNKTGYTRNVAYPIHFVYNDSLYIPTRPLPHSVVVNVSSDGWGLLGHSWFPFQTQPVDYVVQNPLTASRINMATLASELDEQVKKIKVNYLLADTLQLSFDRRATKTVRLLADSTHINLAPRFLVSSLINLTPRTIQVEGPQRLLQGVPDTLLISIPRKRITENYDEELPLNQFRHPLLRTSTDRVGVSFEVGELLSTP